MRPQMRMELAVSSGKTGQISESSDHEEGSKKVKRRKQGADKEMMHAFFSSIELNSSRLGPRREMPALKTGASKKQGLKRPTLEMLDYKMVDLCDEDGPSIIGRRVEVYWPDSRRWFRGRVKVFDHQKMIHKIDYDDGDKEHLDLTKEVFRMEVFPGESPNLKTECHTKNKPKHPNAEVATELQKGREAERRTDVQSHVICLGLQEKDSGNAVNCPLSVSQGGMAEVNSFSAPTDESLAEACLGLKDNMVEVSNDYQINISQAVPNIMKPKDRTPNLPEKTFEDEYLDILPRTLESENPKLLREYFGHRMGIKHVQTSSEKREFQNENRIPVAQMTCTKYFVRRKRATRKGPIM